MARGSSTGPLADHRSSQAQRFFGGDALTLADLWVAPMISYLRLAPSVNNHTNSYKNGKFQYKNRRFSMENGLLRTDYAAIPSSTTSQFQPRSLTDCL